MEFHYLNPVYDRPFADPFVLKHRGEYWAYCTGPWPDGAWFGVLHSRDLARWRAVGGAMEPMPGDWPCLWAPEVSYYGGRFYLYYSCGDETNMQIRVAVADHPAGPFRDSGHRLTAEPFAIDPHVFADADGARYLFYATDYLDHSHVGTGTARDRLLDPFTLAGQPVPVTRARHPWQVYDPSRAAKGGVRWHTVEGPFVLSHKGRYYQMFSGGNWQNPSYGVSYAVSERVDGADEWAQSADGVAVLPILRTVPGQVIGPGHNSVVRGPDNRERYCVYHRWALDGSGRVMAVDPLDWAGERLFLLGPSTDARPLALPTHSDFFAGPGLGPGWAPAGGSWSVADGVAAQTAAASARAAFSPTPPAYLAEVSVAALDPAAPGAFGVAVGPAVQLLIEPADRWLVARLRRDNAWEEHPFPLPSHFEPAAFNLLRVEVGAGRLAVALGESPAQWSAELPGDPAPFALITEGAPAAFAGFALTEGWQDLFERPGSPAASGWLGAPGAWSIAGGALHAPAGHDGAPLLKGPLPAAYELAVNLALSAGPEPCAAIVYPAARPGALGPALVLSRLAGGYELALAGAGPARALPLPPAFDGARPNQLRVRVAAGRLELALEGAPLGAAPAPAGATRIGLAARGAAAFEMVRVTALPPGRGAPTSTRTEP